MSEHDEFDDIPDDFSGAEGINWDELLSGPPPPFIADNPPHGSPSHEAASPGARSASTHYSYDDEELDDAFIAELDAIEQDILRAEAGPFRVAAVKDTRVHGEAELAPRDDGSPSRSHSDAPVNRSRFFSNGAGNSRPSHPAASPFAVQSSKTIGNGDNEAIQPPSLKRPRSGSSPLNGHYQNKKGKGKAQGNEDVLQLLSEFADELTCPICSDIFVAPHLGNPCGHSCCGECGWKWRMKGKHTCAVCRTELSREMPLIPNFAMDNTVEKHIAALGQTGIAEWNPGGKLYEEWNFRKEQWKRNVAERRKVVPQKAPSIQLEAFDLTSDLANDGEEEHEFEIWTRTRARRGRFRR
ncbi:putative zinc finger, C3HC4 type (RING finger) [Lyophyllum shimeji]|uniref:Zinc finger, C3HC4 type (RING finger) n=1 Tax=Lyophyllum shimeji TaxID=47721 RepID=A0A9P3UJ32_LYOSH|nr:putative zinc finger, C3HC4 type (RING finger) [Lyophyllum shimeji]